jgi:hypothetical protein
MKPDADREAETSVCGNCGAPIYEYWLPYGECFVWRHEGTDNHACYVKNGIVIDHEHYAKPSKGKSIGTRTAEKPKFSLYDFEEVIA